VRNNANASNEGVVQIPMVLALTDLSQNPYYIHPRQNPSIPLVNLLLDGENYHSWARSFKKVVNLKNKARFLDGSSPKPNRFDPSYEVWQSRS